VRLCSSLYHTGIYDKLTSLLVPSLLATFFPGFGKTTITSSSGGGAPAPVKFTKEQTEIIQMAKKPGLSKGEIIRVKAAAGTGKTTTLQQIVCALASLGHKKISYVTFNKSAANDAGKRFYNDPVIKTMRAECECKTTHSSAFTSWTRHSNSKLLNPDTDSDIDKVIEANLVKEIDEFLGEEERGAKRRPYASQHHN